MTVIFVLSSSSWAQPDQIKDAQLAALTNASLLFENASLNYSNSAKDCFAVGKVLGNAATLGDLVRAEALNWTSKDKDLVGSIRVQAIMFERYRYVYDCGAARSSLKMISADSQKLLILLQNLYSER